MIKNIVFDLGGVILTLDHEEAVRRFENLGLKDARQQLDPYTQGGIFGQLEKGAIDAETFRQKLSKQVGHDVTYAECRHAWLGYAKDVPQRNLSCLQQLRSQGYRVLLLSNTNPFMMSWAMSNDFDGKGHPLSHYMDACYLSYEQKVMKPDPFFFSKMLMQEQIMPEETLFVDDGPRNVAAASQMGIRTLCPENGTDWTAKLMELIKDN